jgi:hypothetical protein
MKLRLLFSLIFLATGASAPAESTQKPADNAALRYWMAFAQMRDSQVSPAETMRMNAMINGGGPWDETQFGPIVEQNKAAIETMIRGSRLPYCEWGLENDLGPDTPIEYVPKATAMARLNNMYSMRLASAGHYHSAVRSTIAGVRFAQHLAGNGSFLGALTAKTALIPALMQAQHLATSSQVSPDDLAALRETVTALPIGGLDWSFAAHGEGAALHSLLIDMSDSRNPQALYKKWFSDAPDAEFRGPTRKEIEQLDRVMAHYAQLLSMPPEQAEAQLPGLQKEIADLDKTSRTGVPNPARMLAQRTAIVKAQRETLAALKVQ